MVSGNELADVLWQRIWPLVVTLLGVFVWIVVIAAILGWYIGQASREARPVSSETECSGVLFVRTKKGRKENSPSGPERGTCYRLVATRILPERRERVNWFVRDAMSAGYGSAPLFPFQKVGSRKTRARVKNSPCGNG